MNGADVYTNTLAAGTYKLCITASATGITSYTATFSSVTEGNKINATSFCAAHGGGTGSSGSPWQQECIQAAVNTAVSGDTVFLAAGNWALNTSGTGVSISTTINLIGAGSGNTFSVYGNPAQPSITDPCPTALSTLTCVAVTGTSNINSPPGGWIHYFSCTGELVAHMYLDGSTTVTNGGAFAELNADNCTNFTVNDVAGLGLDDNTLSVETHVFFIRMTNLLLENSTFASPIDIKGCAMPPNCTFYAPGGGVQSDSGKFETVQNNYFYGNSFNPIDIDHVMFTGNVMFQGNYPGGQVPDFDPAFGLAACAIGPGVTCDPANSGDNGSYYFTVTNNNFVATSQTFGTGPATNDPTGAGGTSYQVYTGNRLSATQVAIDSCAIHYYNSATSTYLTCPPGVAATSASWSGTTVTFVVNKTPNISAIGTGTFGTVGFSAGYNTPNSANQNIPLLFWTANSDSCGASTCTLTATCGGVQPPCPSTTPATTLGYVAAASDTVSVGMQVNGTVNNDCTESNSPSGNFSITNNSLVGTSAAQLVASGTGILNCWLAGKIPTPHNGTVINFQASQNYLSSPANIYLSDANTVSPSVTGNFCVTSTFTQTDSSTCATTGFTMLPTAAFTLGMLYYDLVQAAYVVPFTAVNFTAQYGAVQWLVSSSSTTPTSGGQTGTGCNGSACSWSFVPPVYLAGVAHGNTVYMWTMDSANNISAAASILVP